MKFYTKEWYNNYALKSLACIFNEFDRRMILVVCDDSMELPEIQTIKTHLDLPYFSDKEKQLRIIAKPFHFPLFEDYDKKHPIHRNALLSQILRTPTTTVCDSYPYCLKISNAKLMTNGFWL